MERYGARRFLSGLFGVSLLLLSGAEATSAGTEAIIQDGSLVGIEYTLKDDQGGEIESNKGKDPLQYTHGTHQLIPGLETGLEGMRIGEKKSIRVAPKDGYGEIVPTAFKEVPRNKIPSDAQQVGAVLAARSPEGRTRPVRVHEVKEETVILDMNHPLAGKILIFDVTILAIQPAAAK
ncbi:MAG TPA: peptidylprolyl isomerase [Candidatus Binatia bacterium]